MHQKRVLLFSAGIALLILAATAYAGGWAIVTVRDLPEYAVAGKRLPLTFMVRQHGMSPFDGLEPKITAKSGTGMVEASAVATKNTGEYTATLVLPRPGNWTIKISGTIDDPTLPELAVIAPGSPTPAPLSQAEFGKRLFVAKGCIGCHVNREVQADSQGGVGPDLTGRRFPDTYLKGVLADPKVAFAKRRPAAEETNWEMPNLGLTKSEIAALAAFINRERPR